MILGESEILIIVLTKMNCCLKSGIYEHCPNSRVHVEVLHFVHRSSIVSLSHSRRDFVHVRHDWRGYVEIMWPSLSFTFSIPWFFWNTGKPQVSPHSFCMQQGLPVTSSSWMLLDSDSENSHNTWFSSVATGFSAVIHQRAKENIF